MMKSDTVVRARIEGKVKARATEVLNEMGPSVSDAIRMLPVRVAAEQALPYDARVPNVETVNAKQEMDRGEGARFASVAELLTDLNSDD